MPSGNPSHGSYTICRDHVTKKSCLTSARDLRERLEASLKLLQSSQNSWCSSSRSSVSRCTAFACGAWFNFLAFQSKTLPLRVPRAPVPRECITKVARKSTGQAQQQYSQQDVRQFASKMALVEEAIKRGAGGTAFASAPPPPPAAKPSVARMEGGRDAFGAVSFAILQPAIIK